MQFEQEHQSVSFGKVVAGSMLPFHSRSAPGLWPTPWAACAEAGRSTPFIKMPDGTLRGRIPTASGLIRDLTVNPRCPRRPQQIPLLGAGGARGWRAIAGTGPERLFIANRTIVKAQYLVQQLAGEGTRTGLRLEDLEGRQFDLIINSTAAGLNAEVPALPDGVLCTRRLGL